ncbi:MAG: cytochrome c biogenesis protein CcsA [Longimonas sp.]|uniref:heme lyase CcmF/NrfE family subunit n=1 Tax=Longimonas sp. TaxID=2039626 RepID=UPI0033555D38
MLGTVGELFIITAFVACALSGITFFWAAQTNVGAEKRLWTRAGRWSWGAMTAGVLVASGILWYLLLTHQYQYAYVYQQTSNELPLRYLISAFWAGQEGSFLFWGIMMCVTGGLLISYVKRRYEAPVMAVVALCQFALLSMVVGLQFGSMPIGASPFMTLAEKFPTAPIFQDNPHFIPADGQGLNDLLQNPWMTIHPPVLFMGFASMVVPFAFAISALWKRKYTQWVRPALPWTIFAILMLGVGIAMGGYWAYITLSFGGYWAWDPVENSSLVPWLLGVAALHTMLVQKKSGSSHKAALILSILAYIFVVYSTFLTRSGILGDVSVHSFVDLGLYNQLLIWIVGMGVLGLGMFAWRYNELPEPDKEPRIISREFMIFSGAMILTAISAVVILGTSTPILGHVFHESPSTVPIEFYNRWTLPLALGLVFLAGVGQLMWWSKMGVEQLNRVVIKPLAAAAAATIAILVLTPFAEQTVILPADVPTQEFAQASFTEGFGVFWDTYGYALMLLMLIFGSFFALFGNGAVLWRIGRGNPRMAGGAVTHIGFAIMMLGIVASSAFDRPLPLLDQIRTTADIENTARENFVLARGETRVVSGYEVTYRDRAVNDYGRDEYVLDITDRQGRSYTLTPEAYEADDGQWFMHPGVKKFFEQDLFVAVTPRAATGIDDDPDVTGGEFQLARGDSTVIGNDEYAIAFKGFDMEVPEHDLPGDTRLAVAAVIEMTDLATNEMRRLDPVYMVTHDNQERYVEAYIEDWDIRLAFTDMDVDTGRANFAIDGVDVMPDDWVVVQASVKPLISLVWIGFIMLSVGFVIALVRRVQDVQSR